MMSLNTIMHRLCYNKDPPKRHIDENPQKIFLNDGEKCHRRLID